MGAEGEPATTRPPKEVVTWTLMGDVTRFIDWLAPLLVHPNHQQACDG